MAEKKVLMQTPTCAAVKRENNNARNLMKLEASDVVGVVVNGGAVGAAVGIIDESILPLLVLCRNSLQGQQLDPPAGVRVVAAAVQYLAQQQALGWLYIRA